MRKLCKSLLVFAALTLAVFSFAACEPSYATLSEDEIRAFADPAVENLLQAMNDADRSRFCIGLDDHLHLSAEAFNGLVTRVIDNVGKYQSKQFVKAERDYRSVSVTYRANFVNEPAGVTITIIYENKFEGTGRKNMITWLRFSSPTIGKLEYPILATGLLKIQH